MSGFCARADAATKKLRGEMTRLPFNRELADGSLSRERFQFYLVQDARYLVGFGRALAVAAARAEDPADLAFFSAAANEAVVTERGLHADYFQRFGLDPDEVEAVRTSPTALGYTSYLLATAQTASYSELIAALLPCFAVYHEVGLAIAETAAPDNPYRAWIDTYADEEFGRAVQSCRAAVDAAAERVGDATEARMLAAVVTATEYEWMFWDSAYRMEGWPTAQWV
ncbi:thiaminase II [Sciscionella marina]|uniref:thiaminase II n=1 Tax=Sciscionella marina TaxID=508770 RepID=UPI00039D4A90|nr:thiaminase II [Sciscionella marina]